VPEYRSANVLLADALLRLEALGGERGILVVEGHDDRRIFYARALHPTQVLVSGGRTLLLSAYSEASAGLRDRLLFLTDCDYAVRAGKLSGGPGLVITSGADVEADLLALGVLEPVVTEILPSALHRDRVHVVCQELLGAARALALPLGRVRMATQPLGVDLNLDDLDFSKYCDRKSVSLSVSKLHSVVATKLARAGVDVNLADLVAATPSDEGMCNGKDLVRAVRFILHRVHRIPLEITDSILRHMVRLALDAKRFEEWSAVQRIRSWEERTGSLILHASDQD
jgi:hypothetical protein